jgi:hypothetical protein
VLFGFFLAAIIAETSLRVGGYSYPQFYTFDESRGYSLRPGVNGWYRDEGEAYVRINSDGMRDYEHSEIKPSGTIRIAILGDSYAEALQIPIEQTFWSVMRDRLEQCSAFAGHKIEVLNFGVSGYGTAHELLTLREKVWKYSPDIVMLAVTTNNDITDNFGPLARRPQSPYFVYRQGKLVLDDSFKNTNTFQFRKLKISEFGRWMNEHSRLVQALYQSARTIRILLERRKARRKSSPSTQDSKMGKADVVARSQELGTDNVVYIEPQDAAWNEAWRVTELLIVKMRNEVRDKGARFVVVTVSNSPQVLPSPASRDDFKKRFSISDLFYPDNRIKSLGEREGITVLTLAPQLQEFAEKNNVFLHGFDKSIGTGHWNATGHRVAGELIAKKICEGALLK